MILILGGTTEAARPYKSRERWQTLLLLDGRNEQAIEAVHAIRLTGGMDEEEMAQFCREKKSRC